MKFEDIKPLLEAVGMANAEHRPLDPDEVARSRDIDVDDVVEGLAWADRCGLISASDDEEDPYWLRRAGRQYLARRGRVPAEALQFLAGPIDDLHAREALRLGSIWLVEDFASAVAAGGAAEYAAAHVPAGFRVVVDDRRGVMLFAAAVALVSRLAAEQPAGCVAEEIMSVALINAASTLLDEAAERGEMGDDDRDAARSHLAGLFDLFDDDDVLALFDMSEPADVAIADQEPERRELRVVDQRVEAWFRPFGGLVPAGHLTPPESA